MQPKNDQTKLNRTELVAVRFSKPELENLRETSFKQRVAPAVLLRNLFLERYPVPTATGTPSNDSN